MCQGPEGKMQQDGRTSIGIIVVAAGRGERAGTSVEGPKQYRRIGGKPVIARTLEALLAWPRTATIVSVIHPDDVALFDAARGQVEGAEGVKTALGGSTRQASVLAGLRAMA